MPSLHKEILTEEQKKLLTLAGQFSKDFGLVGGTAIALHLGHRRSIDFDFFSKKKFGNLSLLNKILRRWKTDQIIVDRLDGLLEPISKIVSRRRVRGLSRLYSGRNRDFFRKGLRFPKLAPLAKETGSPRKIDIFLGERSRFLPEKSWEIPAVYF